jgi:hypothetical protein
MGRTTTQSPYSVSPGVEMVRKWIAGLPEKTGRSLDEWIAFVKALGPATEKERRDWLKTHHNLGTNSAWFIAERCDGKGREEDSPEAYLQAAEEWVEAMFGGKKEALRPVYDALLKAGKGLGRDVKICPCKTIVPFYRKHVFAQVKPTTNNRIDLGFAFGDMKPSGRLIDTGGFVKKDRITHRIPISRVDEIDTEVMRWLKLAYDRDAPSQTS